MKIIITAGFGFGYRYIFAKAAGYDIMIMKQ